MSTCNNHGNEATGKMNATNETTGNSEPCIVRQVCDALEYPTCPFVGNCHHEGDDVKLATMIVQVPYSSCVGGFGMEWQEDEVSEQAGAGTDAGMDTMATTATTAVEGDTTATEPTANTAIRDDLQALIAELREANALIAIDIRRAASEAVEAAEATTDGVDTITIERNTEPTISKAQRITKGKGKAKRNRNRKAKQHKPITERQRQFIDGWLEKLFDAPANIHAMVLVHMPKTLRVYRLLHDAEQRGNWRASAIHLELTQPDRWAPQVENILYLKGQRSEKMFHEVGKAGKRHGTSKKTDRGANSQNL